MTMAHTSAASDLCGTALGASRSRQAGARSRGLRPGAAPPQARRRGSDPGTAQSVERLEAFFGQPREEASGEAAPEPAQPAPAPAKPRLPSALELSRLSQRLTVPEVLDAPNLPSSHALRRHSRRRHPEPLFPSLSRPAPPAEAAVPAAAAQAPGAAAEVPQQPPQQAAATGAAAEALPAATQAQAQAQPGVAAARQKEARQAAPAEHAAAAPASPPPMGLQLPQVSFEPPNLSYLSRLTSAQLQNLQSAAGQLSARLPSWELDAPSLPHLPQLPPLPKQLPAVPSLELDLAWLRQLSGQQLSNLRAAAEEAAAAARRAAGAPGRSQQAERQQGATAAPAAAAAQPEPQQAQQAQQQAAPAQLAAAVEGEAGPSAEAATLEAAPAGGLPGRLGESVHVSVPSMQLPPLGLSKWRQGGLTVWGWSLVAVLAAAAFTGARALLGRQQHAAQQAVREAEARARAAQNRERQRRRFQRALLAAEDFEGGSIDSSVFASVSKKRGSPDLRAVSEEGTEEGKGSATDSSADEAAAASEGAGSAGEAAAASEDSPAGEAGDSSAAGEAGPSSEGGGEEAEAEAEANPFLRGMGAAELARFSSSLEEEAEEGGEALEEGYEPSSDDVYDPRAWDAQTRRAWDAFVAGSKVGQGRLWDSSLVDEGLPATHVDLDKD